MSPTQKQLDSLDENLRYDPDTGSLVWRRTRGRRARVGTGAGFYHSGHWKIVVDGFQYYAADVAWFLGHGEWPPNRVVPANGRPLDTRLDNLELSSDRSRLGTSRGKTRSRLRALFSV